MECPESFWQYGTIGLTSNRLLATSPQYKFLLHVAYKILLLFLLFLRSMV